MGQQRLSPKKRCGIGKCWLSPWAWGSDTQLYLPSLLKVKRQGYCELTASTPCTLVYGLRCISAWSIKHGAGVAAALREQWVYGERASKQTETTVSVEWASVPSPTAIVMQVAVFHSLKLQAARAASSVSACRRYLQMKTASNLI